MPLISSKARKTAGLRKSNPIGVGNKKPSCTRLWQAMAAEEGEVTGTAAASDSADGITSSSEPSRVRLGMRGSALERLAETGLVLSSCTSRPEATPDHRRSDDDDGAKEGEQTRPGMWRSEQLYGGVGYCCGVDHDHKESRRRRKKNEDEWRRVRVQRMMMMMRDERKLRASAPVDRSPFFPLGTGLFSTMQRKKTLAGFSRL